MFEPTIQRVEATLITWDDIQGIARTQNGIEYAININQLEVNIFRPRLKAGDELELYLHLNEQGKVDNLEFRAIPRAGEMMGNHDELVSLLKLGALDIAGEQHEKFYANADKPAWYFPLAHMLLLLCGFGSFSFSHRLAEMLNAYFPKIIQISSLMVLTIFINGILLTLIGLLFLWFRQHFARLWLWTNTENGIVWNTQLSSTLYPLSLWQEIQRISYAQTWRKQTILLFEVKYSGNQKIKKIKLPLYLLNHADQTRSVEILKQRALQYGFEFQTASIAPNYKM